MEQGRRCEWVLLEEDKIVKLGNGDGYRQYETEGIRQIDAAGATVLPGFIDRKMVVVYRGKVYDIEYPNDYGDEGQYTELICVLRSNDTEGPRLEPVVDAEGYYATATVEGRRRWQGMTPDTEEVYAAALAEDLDEYAPEEVGDDAAE